MIDVRTMRPAVEIFALTRASQALQALADGRLRGAAVLTLDGADRA